MGGISLQAQGQRGWDVKPPLLPAGLWAGWGFVFLLKVIVPVQCPSLQSHLSQSPFSVLGVVMVPCYVTPGLLYYPYWFPETLTVISFPQLPHWGSSLHLPFILSHSASSFPGEVESLKEDNGFAYGHTSRNWQSQNPKPRLSKPKA